MKTFINRLFFGTIIGLTFVFGGSFATAKAKAKTATTETKDLKIEDIKVGDGAVAEKGKTVSVHYTGKIKDKNGTKFDSSIGRGPFEFSLGSGQVIRGWDEGVVGMKVHGKRELTISPDYGYGPGGHPPVIPPNSTLWFEVELLAVK